MRLDLPPGRQEHQKFVEHNICLANYTNRKGCFLQRSKQMRIPQPKEYLDPVVLSRHGPRVGTRINN